LSIPNHNKLANNILDPKYILCYNCKEEINYIATYQTDMVSKYTKQVCSYVVAKIYTLVTITFLIKLTFDSIPISASFGSVRLNADLINYCPQFLD